MLLVDAKPTTSFVAVALVGEGYVRQSTFGNPKEHVVSSRQPHRLLSYILKLRMTTYICPNTPFRCMASIMNRGYFYNIIIVGISSRLCHAQCRKKHTKKMLNSLSWIQGGVVCISCRFLKRILPLVDQHNSFLCNIFDWAHRVTGCGGWEMSSHQWRNMHTFYLFITSTPCESLMCEGVLLYNPNCRPNQICRPNKQPTTLQWLGSDVNLKLYSKWKRGGKQLWPCNSKSPTRPFHAILLFILIKQ